MNPVTIGTDADIHANRPVPASFVAVAQSGCLARVLRATTCSQTSRRNPWMRFSSPRSQCQLRSTANRLIEYPKAAPTRTPEV